MTNKKWKKKKNKCIKKEEKYTMKYCCNSLWFWCVRGYTQSPPPFQHIYIYIYIYICGRREQIGSSLPAAIAVEFSFFSLDIPVKSRYFVLKTSGHTPICWRPSWWLWFVKVVFPCLIFRRGPNSMIDKIWGGSGCFFLILPAAQLTEVKIL